MKPHTGMVYYLKKADGSIYGPSELATVISWAREGRVAPDDLISQDQEFWYPAPTLTDLEMNWLVQLADGTQYGPIHLQALQELVAAGSLSEDDLITNRITEQMCTIREALSAAVTQPTATPPPLSAAPSSQSETTTPKSGPAAENASVPETAVAEVGLTGAEIAPSVATTTSAATSAEPPPAAWRDLAARKDFLERELVKWKQMYEQEHKNLVQIQRNYEERIEALRKSELAALTRAEQLERKLKKSEENYRVLSESLSNDPTKPYAQQLVALTEMHRDLTQRYDALAHHLQEKNAEIVDLLQARSQIEARAIEQLREMQERAETERKEADQARRRALEIENDYLQMVQAYRDLNEKFMRLRHEVASARHPSPPASGSAHKR